MTDESCGDPVCYAAGAACCAAIEFMGFEFLLMDPAWDCAGYDGLHGKAERTSPTQRQSISENQFTAHVHARPAVDGVSGVLISDSEYPVRVAFSLLNKLLDEFMIKVAKGSWQTQANNLALSGNVPSKGEGILKQSEFPQAQEYLVRYQDPRQADTILRVQQELDDTKIVLVRTGIQSYAAQHHRLCLAAWRRLGQVGGEKRLTEPTEQNVLQVSPQAK